MILLRQWEFGQALEHFICVDASELWSDVQSPCFQAH